MKRLPYKEGSWFAVPLRHGGYAVGVVSRAAPGGGIVLAYLFGTKYSEVPGLISIEKFQPRDAIKRLRIGDLGLVKGEWPIIGISERWRREEWTVPSFVRRSEVSMRAWRVDYADSDPSQRLREKPVDFDVKDLEADALWGYGAVEMLLSKSVGE